jgi:hypothetical protein
VSLPAILGSRRRELSSSISERTEKPMSLPEITSRDEWLVARKGPAASQLEGCAAAAPAVRIGQ